MKEKIGAKDQISFKLNGQPIQPVSPIPSQLPQHQPQKQQPKDTK